jgi:3',5'-cyclic AMP phosphodiesterase CpdA
MTHFRILHASDFHLAVRPFQTAWQVIRSWFAETEWLSLLMEDGWGERFRSLAPFDSYDPDILEAFLDFVWQPPEEYDVLLLSGDLATTGSAADLQRARQLLLASVAEERTTLAGLPSPVALMPGNHDRFGPNQAGLRLAVPGDRTFDSVFPEWRAGQGTRSEWPARSGVQPVLLEKAGHTLLLLLCDLTLAPLDWGSGLPFGWLGQGKAYPHRIQGLIENTRSQREIGKNFTILWVVHFDPTFANPGLRLLEASRLLEAGRDEAVSAILCGHSHQRSRVVASGPGLDVPILVCGSASSCSCRSGNYVNMIEVHVEETQVSSLDLKTYRYSRTAGQFELEP